MKSAAAESSGLQNAALSVLLGVLSGVVLSVLLLVLFSVLMVVRDLPTGAIMPLAYTALAGGGFCGGVVAGRVLRRRGLPAGAATGLLYALVLLLCGALLGQAAMGGSALLKLAVCAAAGGVGGVLGCNMRARRRH